MGEGVKLRISILRERERETRGRAAESAGNFGRLNFWGAQTRSSLRDFKGYYLLL